MEPMSNLVGPEPSVVHPLRNRQLVVAVGGASDVETIDAAFNRFGIGTQLASSVTFMLFHYDDNPLPWMAKSWYSSVIRISVHKQMKWLVYVHVQLSMILHVHIL
jgi:ABC-type transport system substrate-binding protein